jgi:hypothetical protein
MGTYGVTHVKKDNQIITLSDSYDGYLDGMGKANMFGIKYFETPLLRSLFDQYNASTKVPVDKAKEFQEDNSEEGEAVSERKIKEVIFRVEQDTKNADAVNWIRDVLEGDIPRTSVCGFATFLYLNLNNHYGRDYNYCDYLVDLDEEVFSFNGVRIPFEKIRNASEEHLLMLCSEDDSFLPEDVQGLVEEAFEYVNESEDEKKDQALVEKVVNAFFSIDQKVLAAHFKQMEDDFEQARLAHHAQQNSKPNQTSDGMRLGGFSIHSCEMGMPSLRKVVTLIQALGKAIPETEFLKSHVEWSANEQYSAGGLRIFSPKTNEARESEIHKNFVAILERKMKLGMNIMSSSGVWGADGEIAQEPSFFGEIVGPGRSLFSLNDKEMEEAKKVVLEGLHPFLSLHVNYDEVRPLLLKEGQKVATPMIWTYMALLNQDKEVFERVYPMAKELVKALDKDATKTLSEKYLISLEDGMDIQSIVAVFAKELDKEFVAAKSEEFLEVVKASGFFGDVAPHMNDLEKKKYMGSVSGGGLKMK